MTTTWRKALTDAQAGVGQAYEHRREIVRAAHDAGLSLRKIADVIGISAAGVHRIVGKQGANTDGLLDAIATVPIRECDGSGGFGPPPNSGLLGWVACPGCARCQR